MPSVTPAAGYRAGRGSGARACLKDQVFFFEIKLSDTNKEMKDTAISRSITILGPMFVCFLRNFESIFLDKPQPFFDFSRRIKPDPSSFENELTNKMKKVQTKLRIQGKCEICRFFGSFQIKRKYD